MTNPAVIQQLSEETSLPIAGTLYADALSSGGESSTYLGMMRHNAVVLHEALAQPGHDDHAHDGHEKMHMTMTMTMTTGMITASIAIATRHWLPWSATLKTGHGLGFWPLTVSA